MLLKLFMNLPCYKNKDIFYVFVKPNKTIGDSPTSKKHIIKLKTTEENALSIILQTSNSYWFGSKRN